MHINTLKHLLKQLVLRAAARSASVVSHVHESGELHSTWPGANVSSTVKSDELDSPRDLTFLTSLRLRGV